MTKRVIEALLLLAVAAAGGCQDAPSSSFLDPTGKPPTPATGSISGTVVFPDVSHAPFPVAEVYAVLDADPTCTSVFQTIHVTGNYTTPEWDTSIWNDTPGMTQVVGCVWFDTIHLPVKQLAWKFVLNKNWDPSYGTATGYVGFEGPVDIVSGTGTELKADVTTAGDYTFILNEGSDPPGYRILPRAQAPIAESSASDRTFSVENLPNGTYTLAVVAEGYPTRRLAGIQVTGKDVPVGPVSLSGVITGQVVFEGSPHPAPIATIQVTEAGGASVIATAQTDTTSTFEIAGLSTGAYDLHFSAFGYSDTTVANVSFTEGEETNVGDVPMRAAVTASITGTITFQGTSAPPYPVATIYAISGARYGCASEDTTVHVTGNYNGWDQTTWNTTPGMTLIANYCVWVETIHLDPATLNDYGAGVLGWKFILDKSWDTAYGRPPGSTGGLSGRTALVTGEGTELQATIPQAGDWVFILNETGKPDDVRYRVALVDDAPLGFSDTQTGAFVVDKLDAGTYEVIVTAPGYQTAHLSEIPLSGTNFDVDVISLVPSGR